MDDVGTIDLDLSSRPGQLIARIVGVFAIVGLGLGVGALIFLWIVDFFEPTEDIEDIGAAILGGIAIGAVLVFALLIGVVLAALCGMHVAHQAETRPVAIRVAGLGAAIGHIALVAVLGVILIVGVNVFRSASGEARDTPAPTIAPTPSREPTQSCEDVFGQGSEICQGQVTDPTPEPFTPDPLTPDPFTSEPTTEDTTSLVAVGNVAKLGLGVVPAAVVGALVAGLLFTPLRRRRERGA